MITKKGSFASLIFYLEDRILNLFTALLRRFRPSHIPLAALALWLCWGTRPHTVIQPLPPPQQVITSNPLVGVHTRLTDEVETWKVQRTMQMVREMGASWIVEYFPWPYIEPFEDEYTWGHADRTITYATNQGLTVIARLGWVPAWARPDPDKQQTTQTYLDAEHYEDFAEFVADFAARYRDQVEHIIIWNEPNLSFEWGYQPVDPEAYTEMLSVVYPRTHAANPDVVILAGALAPTNEPEGSPAGLSDLLYLERMYQAGAADYFDALSAHAYGLTQPPDAAPVTDTINFRRVELLREIMVAYGDEETPIYVTEAGWNDHPRWVHAVTPAQRIVYTIGAYEWAREQWPWCPAVAIWAFRYPASTLSYHDYYAFVTPAFEPRVIYQDIQDYALPAASH